MDIDEFELWEAEDAEEFASSLAGDMGFIIDQALDARREALVALPVEPELMDAYARLAEGQRDWKHVIIVPTSDALVAVDDSASNVAALARLFMTKGARVMPLSAGKDEYKAAARSGRRAAAGAELAVRPGPADARAGWRRGRAAAGA